MNKLDREAVILRAAKLAKKSTFGVTGVKIELEAVFGRRNTPEVETVEHEPCNGDGCEGCHYDGWVYPEGVHNWHSTDYCQQWLLEYLSRYDLARIDEDGVWEPKKPLVFAYCYADQSVDTEFTATLSLKKAESIFLLPKIVEAWNAMGEEIGNGVNVDNAGMHMSLLYDPECYYSSSREATSDQIRQFANFRKSMQLLLPALYFLGSSNEEARSLHFRQPRIERDAKHSAIYYVGNALEFRIFDTCYDNPEQVLDNFVVMRNCIRYWQDEYRDPGMSKLAREVYFGNDRGRELSRFYTSHTHMDVLNLGLRKLKPSYYSIKQLKEQRKFGLNKRTLNSALALCKKQAEAAYKEYESRFEWSINVKRKRFQAEILEQRMYQGHTRDQDLDAVTVETDAEAERYIVEERSRKQPAAEYIDNKVKEFVQGQRGDFRLRAV